MRLDRSTTRAAAVCVFFVMLATALAACGDDGSADTSANASTTGTNASTTGTNAGTSGDLGFTVDTAAVERAAPVYAQYCAFCHGDQGQGYVSDNANALANPAFLATSTDAFLRDAILHGRPGTPMSAWGQAKGGPLSDQDIDDLVHFMRAWQTEPLDTAVHDRVVEGSAPRGRAVYGLYCADCHGDTGQGVTALSLNNPWFLATASDGFIRHAIEGGRAGTPMPAYGATLTAQNIDDLTALIRSWAIPPDTEPVPEYQSDLTRAVLNPDAADPEFTLREGRYAPADEVKAALDAGQRLIVLDARPPNDYLTSHIPGAVNVPFYAMERAIDVLPRDVWIVAYCGCPHAVSGQAVDALRAAGYPQSVVLDEGFYVWQERGYGVREGAPEDDAGE